MHGVQFRRARLLLLLRKSVLLELAIQHLGPPTEILLDVRGFRCRPAQREKNVQIDVGDLDLRDSRLWAHNLSARMGLEVRGAMMNTPQQKDIPNARS